MLLAVGDFVILDRGIKQVGAFAVGTKAHSADDIVDFGVVVGQYAGRDLHFKVNLSHGLQELKKPALLASASVSFVVVCVLLCEQASQFLEFSHALVDL